MEKLDKLRDEAYQRKSEADKLVKDSIGALKRWDTKTEELVSQLHQYRDEYVGYRCIIVMY